VGENVVRNLPATSQKKCAPKKNKNTGEYEMETIMLDEKKCIKCGKCVEECPGDVLRMNGSLQIAKPELCISCGHCAAICPEAAIVSSNKNTRNPFNVSAFDANLPMDQKLRAIALKLSDSKNPLQVFSA